MSVSHLLDVAALAVRFVDARQALTIAKQARNRCRCPHVERGDYESGQGPVGPCWVESPDDLCEVCAEREKAHKATTECSKVASTALRRLQAGVRKMKKATK